MTAAGYALLFVIDCVRYCARCRSSNCTNRQHHASRQIARLLRKMKPRHLR